MIVAPRSHDSFIERGTMRNGRIRFWRTLRKAGGSRVRLVYPSVERGGRATDTMIHSKIMVVDDRFLRVGSANMNNRSMGADTECDLAVEAATDGERVAIVAIRNRLLGEHCGVAAEDVAASFARHGSLVEAADTLAAQGHRLRAIDDGEPDDGGFAAVAEEIADPPRPLRFKRLARRLFRRGWARAAASGLMLVLIAAAVLGLTLAWQYTGLSEIAAPERVREFLSASAGEPWAFALVLLAYLVGGAVAFPVTILILATAAVFGPWLGALYAALGAGSSALLMYWIGARFGEESLGRLLGARWERARAGLRKRGLLAIVAVRVVPVAPFTLINLAAGASSIRLTDYVIGTVLGMGPGLVVMSVLGDRIVSVFANPSAEEIGLLALGVFAWLALSLSAQAIVSRFGDRAS